MPHAPIVGSKRTATGVVHTVRYRAAGRVLTREFPDRDAARAFAREVLLQQRGGR